MGKITGFLEFERSELQSEPVEQRIKHYREFLAPPTDRELKNQAARCMDCGIPYCHNACPVNNQIPDWNDLVFEGSWQQAEKDLSETNNFPEITGRICPAPCEEACTLNINNKPVAIKNIERAIADKAWENGWITPRPAPHKTGKKVGIIGSGPCGLAAAQQLARSGHEVTVFEKNNKPGGLLRYGIPDFKLEKSIIERRITQMEAEGVKFMCNTHIEGQRDVEALIQTYDAVLLAAGSEHPRDLPIEGRNLDGVHFAMDFLTQQNRHNANEDLGDKPHISAKGKHVIVIGGGDTGSDCIGTSFRQGALSVTQLEIMPAPPEHEDKPLTWPHWPLKMRTSTSQAEGALRDFSVNTTHFSGENGRVKTLHIQRLDENFKPVSNTQSDAPADLVLLAMGFVHPVQEGLISHLDLRLDERKNVLANDVDYKTSTWKVFTAGDMRRGQSLVVWAIREGRQAAKAIDSFLTGTN